MKLYQVTFHSSFKIEMVTKRSVVQQHHHMNVSMINRAACTPSNNCVYASGAGTSMAASWWSTPHSSRLQVSTPLTWNSVLQATTWYTRLLTFPYQLLASVFVSCNFMSYIFMSLAISCLAFSCVAVWFLIFMSCIFTSCIFSATPATSVTLAKVLFHSSLDHNCLRVNFVSLLNYTVQNAEYKEQNQEEYTESDSW